MDGSTLSGRLAFARLVAVELSARELSSRAGLSNAVVTRLERENRPRPSAYSINALARVLGVEAAWLFDGSQPCIRSAPELDPTVPEHRDAIATHIRAAVDRARQAIALDTSAEAA
jgi:transcriptional regulator with XRE-family HTH domain